MKLPEQHRALAQALGHAALRMNLTERQALFVIRNFVPVLRNQSLAERETVIDATLAAFKAHISENTFA